MGVAHFFFLMETTVHFTWQKVDMCNSPDTAMFCQLFCQHRFENLCWAGWPNKDDWIQQWKPSLDLSPAGPFHPFPPSSFSPHPNRARCHQQLQELLGCPPGAEAKSQLALAQCLPYAYIASLYWHACSAKGNRIGP